MTARELSFVQAHTSEKIMLLTLFALRKSEMLHRRTRDIDTISYLEGLGDPDGPEACHQGGALAEEVLLAPAEQGHHPDGQVLELPLARLQQLGQPLRALLQHLSEGLPTVALQQMLHGGMQTNRCTSHKRDQSVGRGVRVLLTSILSTKLRDRECGHSSLFDIYGNSRPLDT